MTEWNHIVTGLEHYDLLPDDEETKERKDDDESRN